MHISRHCLFSDTALLFDDLLRLGSFCMCVRAAPNKNIKFALITSTLRKTSLLTCSYSTLCRRGAPRCGHSAKVSPIKTQQGDEIACIIFRFTYLRWTGQTKMMPSCVCTLHIPAGLPFFAPSLSRRPQLVASSSSPLLSRMS